MDCHRGEASQSQPAGSVTEASFPAQRRARFQGLNIQAGLKHAVESLRHDKLMLPRELHTSPTSVAATQSVKWCAASAPEKERETFIQTGSCLLFHDGSCQQGTGRARGTHNGNMGDAEHITR